MTAKRDYYEVLEVTRTATSDEIKKSYRRLARQYHPDVSKDKKTAEEKFKELSEAYDVLSDDGPNGKRATYDRFGMDAFDHRKGGNPAGQGGDPFDIFRNGGYTNNPDLNEFLEQMFRDLRANRHGRRTGSMQDADPEVKKARAKYNSANNTWGKIINKPKFRVDEFTMLYTISGLEGVRRETENLNAMVNLWEKEGLSRLGKRFDRVRNCTYSTSTNILDPSFFAAIFRDCRIETIKEYIDTAREDVNKGERRAKEGFAYGGARYYQKPLLFTFDAEMIIMTAVRVVVAGVLLFSKSKPEQDSYISSAPPPASESAVKPATPPMAQELEINQTHWQQKIGEATPRPQIAEPTPRAKLAPSIDSVKHHLNKPKDRATPKQSTPKQKHFGY